MRVSTPISRRQKKKVNESRENVKFTLKLMDYDISV